jgi:hypothetical protein
MKKYILTLIVAVIAFACADDDVESAFREYVGIRTTDVPANVSENSAGITIPLFYGGNVTNPKDVVVNWEVVGGTYGTDYTVVGGSASTGTVTIPAGKTFTEAINKVVIKGVPDFKNEPDVPLTLKLTSADNGVQVGYPMAVSYSFIIADDDCLLDFEGELEGIDTTLPDKSTVAVSGVMVSDLTDTEFVIKGLGTGMIVDLWAEDPQVLYPVTVTIAPGGALTIAPQPIYQTDYQGDPYEYSVSGTGQINYCDGSISFIYDVFYTDGSGSVYKLLGLKDPFVAKIKPVKD